jgi:hypothetical protein
MDIRPVPVRMFLAARIAISEQLGDYDRLSGICNQTATDLAEYTSSAFFGRYNCHSALSSGGTRTNGKAEMRLFRLAEDL